MRLIEMVEGGGGKLSVVLAGGPKLRNDLRHPDSRSSELEKARKAVDAALEVFIQAGQEHYRRYFEDRLRAIDGELAVQ